jgi:hypothetical protein
MINSTLRKIRTQAQDLRNALQGDRVKLKEWGRARPADLRFKYLGSILKGNWETLAGLARADLKARRVHLRGMRLSQDRAAALAAKMGYLAAYAKVFYAPFSKREDWPVLREKTKHLLMTHHVSPDEAAKMLADFETKERRPAWPGWFMRSTERIEALDRLARQELAATMGATLALAVARYNQHVGGNVHPTTDPRKVCKRIQAETDQAESDLYRALAAADLPLAWAYATRLSRTAAASLMNSVLIHSAAVAIKRRAGSDGPEEGRLALTCGNLTRQLLRAIALGQYVAWIASWPANAPLAREWLLAAGRLPFAANSKPCATAAVANLAARPATADGKLVTVEGKLGAVKIVHRKRKVISSAPVSDAKGKSITIAIPYCKLDSGGMVPGAYVEVSGTWQKQSKEVSGSALLIDRLSFGELGKRAWRDWATAQLAHVFAPVPHGLAASWSWEPGSDGAGNQLRYGVWFAEQAGG